MLTSNNVVTQVIHVTYPVLLVSSACINSKFSSSVFCVIYKALQSFISIYRMACIRTFGFSFLNKSKNFGLSTDTCSIFTNKIDL